jgi:hypothetical protein
MRSSILFKKDWLRLSLSLINSCSIKWLLAGKYLIPAAEPRAAHHRGQKIARFPLGFFVDTEAAWSKLPYRERYFS